MLMGNGPAHWNFFVSILVGFFSLYSAFRHLRRLIKKFNIAKNESPSKHSVKFFSKSQRRSKKNPNPGWITNIPAGYQHHWPPQDKKSVRTERCIFSTLKNSRKTRLLRDFKTANQAQQKLIQDRNLNPPVQEKGKYTITHDLWPCWSIFTNNQEKRIEAEKKEKGERENLGNYRKKGEPEESGAPAEHVSTTPYLDPRRAAAISTPIDSSRWSRARHRIFSFIFIYTKRMLFFYKKKNHP